MAHEAFLLELGESGPALFDLLVRNRPVDLVEVDRVDAEPREAFLELTPEGIAPQGRYRHPVRAFRLARLREDVRAPAGIFAERSADDLF